MLLQADTDPYTAVVLRNANGVQADILPIGGTVHRLLVPDANGKADDIVLGFDDAKTYQVRKILGPCHADSNLLAALTNQKSQRAVEATCTLATP